ncbi:MAG TPA: hypothetical protein VKG44_04790, partial [Candidatus Baltobacteraceae bacterium]|nr:hypothetical protein [Candidatus Baltobacteraceae bacterium]
WTGYQNQVGHLPLYFRLRSSYDFAHNSITPLQTLGGETYPTIWGQTFGITLTSPTVRLGSDRRGPAFAPQLNASLDQQIQGSSLPHTIDTRQLTLSLSKALDPTLHAVLQYTNLNVSDHYGSQQLQVYPVYSGIGLNGQLYPSYRAFRGFATTRSYLEQLLFTPNLGLSFSASMREDVDFPEAVPQPAGQPQVGVPPYQATFDVRFRINRILAIDISRSYWFNWGGYYRWGSPYGVPAFNIQVVK